MRFGKTFAENEHKMDGQDESPITPERYQLREKLLVTCPKRMGLFGRGQQHLIETAWNHLRPKRHLAIAATKQ